MWAEDSEGWEGTAEEEGLRVEVESRRSRSFGTRDFNVRGKRMKRRRNVVELKRHDKDYSKMWSDGGASQLTWTRESQSGGAKGTCPREREG